MAFRDFDSAIEVDPSDTIFPDGVKIDWVNVTRNEDVHCYFDDGVDNYDGDFEQPLEVYCDSGSANGGQIITWMLSNDIDDEKGLRDANKSFFSLLVSTGVATWDLHLRERDTTTTYSDFKAGLAFDTPYYLRAKRVMAVGTYGTLYCFIYSDLAMTVLVDTLIITLHTSIKKFKYYWGFNSINSGHVNTATGYTQNHGFPDITGAPSMLPLLGVGHA